VALAALVLAACGSASHGTTVTVTAAAPTTAPAARTAAPVGTTAPATTAAAPVVTVPPATAAPGAPLAAGLYSSVNAAAAALLAAPGGLDQAVTQCAGNGDCATAQAIAAKVRAAETALSVQLLAASDAVVHRYRGRLDDFFERTTEANAQRLDDALGRVGEVAATFRSACAAGG
jgi:hypothetical protein